eukprot:CAMPEP_0113963586 /NCGR_PEP_ID=MMETSP0011_2-20120614/6599_1 /TAXON_ID=101924 /ORGANISM="Rhodosorus marinus" /LENGTH=281 /DNA_ID=CAMNT_0000975659 /DNA_START=459 /DNA_END=1306 /DNA_ORIENTATION=- /assembly_acc=CAM_ASM_000156
MQMDRSDASENVLALPELPPEVLDIIVRHSGVRSMIKLAQVGDARHRSKELSSPPFLLYGKFLLGLHSPVVEEVSESFYVTVQKWAEFVKQLNLGCFHMDDAPGQEQVLFVLRLFRNLEGLSIDRWKWAQSFPDICSFVIENYTSERLRRFDVEDLPISEGDIKNLATRCPNITHLGLRYCDFVDDLFLGNELPELWPHGLSSINISNCPNVTDTGLRELYGFVSSIQANSIRRTGRTLRLVRGGRAPLGLARGRAPIRRGQIHMSGLVAWNLCMLSARTP